MAEPKNTAFFAATIKTYLYHWLHDSDRMLSKTYIHANDGVDKRIAVEFLKYWGSDFGDWTLLGGGGGCIIWFLRGGERIQIDLYHHQCSPEKFLRSAKGKQFIIVISPRHLGVEEPEDEVEPEEDEDDCIEAALWESPNGLIFLRDKDNNLYDKDTQELVGTWDEEEDEDEEKFEDCMNEFSFEIASAIGQHLMVC